MAKKKPAEDKKMDHKELYKKGKPTKSAPNVPAGLKKANKGKSGC